MAKLEMRLKNREKWTAALGKLSQSHPVSQTWSGVPAILAALTPFVECNCNHVLLPTSGGMDVTEARPSREKDCIELVIGSRIAYIVKPERLILEYFPDAPLESFLLLELGNLAPSGVYKQLTRSTEELVEVNGQYIDRYHWDEGTYGSDGAGDPIPLSDNSRLIVRFLAGKAMVVSKGSIWNGIPATYDGRHSGMQASDIRSQIDQLLARIGPDYLKPKPKPETA